MADLQKLCFGCMREKPDFSPECPYCKYDGTKDNDAKALPIKTLLQKRYYVGKILNENGEGITYIGYDALKQNVIRIREFFPDGIAQRINTLVKPFLQSEYTFDAKKNEFNMLARSLSRMNGFACLLNILDIFEENGTAYYITEYVEAITLRDFLLRNGGVLNYEQFRPIFMPLLSTISSLHAVDIVHRGISPDTILVGKDGKLRLTEFCIQDARTARTELKANLHKGYAAIEQYGFDGEQGPWTDVYALGALMYRILVGNPPPEATARVTDDKMTIPAEVAKALPGNVLSVLANSLEILPDDRTKSVEELRSELTSAPKLTAKYNNRTGEVKAVASKQYRNKVIAISVSVTALVLAIVIGILALLKNPEEQTSEQEEPSTETSIVSTTEKIIGSYDSDEIPYYVGIKLCDLLTDSQYYKDNSRFEFEIIKEYNSLPEGEIISQSPAPGTKIKENQVVKLTVSLGSEEISMPNVVGLSEKDAYIALLKEGFKNIEFRERFDQNSAPESVVSVSPNVGETVKRDEKIVVYMNTYVTTTPPSTTTTTTTTTASTQPEKTDKSEAQTSVTQETAE